MAIVRGTVADEVPAPDDRSEGLAIHLALCGEQPLYGGRTFDLAGVRELTIGRGDILAFGQGDGKGTARLEVFDQTMSGRHARLVLEPDLKATLEDLGSRNGTRVRGHRKMNATLGPGDWFVAGRSTFMLRPAAPRVIDPPSLSTSSLLRTAVPSFAETLRVAASLAPSTVPLLLVGETGTGKEVTAREIHNLSGRVGKLVAVNCAALPDTLVESELFGVRRGAYSDAKEDRPGLVRAADRGTLLLDEVGDLPLASQAKLLRFLQEGEVLALGASAPVHVDVRIIAATQTSLGERVAGGQFRPDLLGRLQGCTLTLPPLRERLEDLGFLVAALLARHAGADAARFRFAGDACVALFRRPWGMNIRELERAIHKAVVLAAATGEITAKHLAHGVTQEGENMAEPQSPEQLRDELLASLRRHQGNISAVAREMGKARMQIHRWMEQLAIDPIKFRPGQDR